MPKIARTPSQISALKEAVDGLVVRLKTDRKRLAESIAEKLGEDIPSTLRKVYSWSKGKTSPSPAYIAALVALEKQRFPELNEQQRIGEWETLSRPRTKSKALTNMEKIASQEPEAGEVMQFASERLARGINLLRKDLVLRLLRNFISQEVMHLRRKEWSERAKAPQVLFLWDEPTRASKWLGTSRLGIHLAELIRKHVAVREDGRAPILGCIQGVADAQKAQIVKVAETLASALRRKAEEQWKLAGWKLNEDVLGNLIEIWVSSGPSNENIELTHTNFWVFSTPTDTWASWNLEDKELLELVEQDAFKDEKTKWSTVVVEIPFDDAKALLKNRQIDRDSLTFRFVGENWKRVWPPS